MQRFCRELLGILCLTLTTLVTFKMRILIQVLTTLEALLRPYADIIQRLGGPPPQPFRFLDLPPEIRIIVYDHHFSLYRHFWNQQQAKKMALPPNPILNLNRLIYREAAHVLYSQATAVIKIAYTKSVYSVERPIAVKLQQMSHVLIHMRVIRLEIRWPDYSWLAWSEEGGRCGHPVRQLKENVETVCAYFAGMPNLETVKISFLTEEDWPGWSPLSTAKYRMLDLLRPLRMIRRENPEVVVEMPDGCPVSTAELATRQKRVSGRRGFGNRLALVEELRTRGGVFGRWKIPCVTQHDWDIRYSYATKSQGLCIPGLDTGPLHPLPVVGVSKVEWTRTWKLSS